MWQAPPQSFGQLPQQVGYHIHTSLCRAFPPAKKTSKIGFFCKSEDTTLLEITEIQIRKYLNWNRFSKQKRCVNLIAREGRELVVKVR